MPVTASLILHKSLVSDSLWERLVNRLIREQEILRPEAEQIVDATLAFLKLCGEHPTMKFVPSIPVDTGWHTFLMYTREYAEFCARVCGRFVHHGPNDQPERREKLKAKDTVAFMVERGIPHNTALWPDASGDCNNDCCDVCGGDSDGD